MIYAGMMVHIIDAQQQRRTPCDVAGPWMRPRVPSKALGRRISRRQFKRAHPPGNIMLYREPDDVLVFGGKIIATPAQADALRKAIQEF